MRSVLGKIGTGSLIMRLLLSTFSGVACAQGQPSSIAVIRGEDNDAADDAFVSQWEVGLSRAPGIQLLERSFIQDVLDEHHLRAAGFTAHIPNAAQWGRLLSADILLFARRVPHEEMPIYNIRVVEGGTGIVLLSFLTHNEVRSEDVARVTDAATLAVARKHIDETKRHYLGILQIKSEEVGTALDGASQSLSVFLAEDLARSPHVVILDREHLQYLQQEQALTGLDLKLKSSAVVVEGGLKYGPQQKTIDVTLILRSLGPAPGEDVVSFQIPAADMNFEKARRVLAQKILDHLSVKPPRFQTRDPRKETGLYMRQVPLLLASGKYDEAVRCAEVALALSPAQETRYWAARAWYALGRSLRTSSSLATMNMIRTAPAQATRLPQRSDDGMALRIAKPREKNGRSVERSHGTYRVDGGQLERMLSALLRAYTLVEEITRIHISNSEGGVIPDPLKGFSPDEPRERLRMNSPLQAILKGQDFRNQRLLRQVIDVSRSSVDQQRKFYAAHYTRSGDIQAAYWTTWENEKALNADHYGYDPQRMTQMVGGAFEVFNRLPPGNLEIRLKGLAGVMALGPAMELSPEEKALYESLLASEDPWIQLLANKQLIRDDALGFSLNMMAIFAGKLAGNPAVWTMNDEKFIPDLLRSAIHRLAVSDREALLTHGQSVYQIILKKENVRHLLAWQSRDVFWPYVNSLVLNHREKEARRVMEQAVAVLKDNLFPEGGEDGRSAGALRLQLDRGLFRLGMKGAADHDVMTGAEDIGKPSSIRLRPEIEPPGPDAPLDLSAFPPAPESSRGLQTTTVSRSSQRVTAEEGGDVFSAGWTRTIDAEGNEQYTVYNVDAAAEKEKEKIQPSPAWDRYVIERMSTRVTAIAPPEQRYRTGQKAAVTRNHLVDGEKIYIVKEGRQEDDLKVTVFEHDLRDAHDNRQLGTAVVPVADQRTFFVTALTSDDNHLYVGTAGGLLVLKKGGGDVIEKVATMPVSAEHEPSYLGFSNQAPETRTKGVRHLHEKNGFPDNRILSLAHFDGRIYIGIGSAHEGIAGDCGFAAYDPHTGTYDLLASNRSLKKRHPLDGGDVYQIDAILVDASRQALWLAVHGNSKLNGLWRFDIKERQFRHQVKEDLAIQDMQWVGNEILYVMYGSGLTRYDPQTEKKTWLLGYAVSVYSGPSSPVPPKGVQGAPLYGYPATRLWPVAMQGEDLFTLGWTGREVLLNHRGGKVFEKSMLNSDAGVVTGKRYLAGDEHGIWIITDYGEVYRLRPRMDPGGKEGR